MNGMMSLWSQDGKSEVGVMSFNRSMYIAISMRANDSGSILIEQEEEEEEKIGKVESFRNKSVLSTNIS